jgi:signal transduction histidine kinase
MCLTDSIDIDKEIINMNELINDVVNKFSYQEEGICFDVETKNQEVLWVTCNAFMIERVLKNLISNGIQYGDKEKKLSVKMIVEDPFVRIEVFNSANPISEKDIEKIWDSFYKCDQARSRDIGGHGLGLSIVKAIMEAHKQAFGLMNVEGGVCFWFQLDLAKES